MMDEKFDLESIDRTFTNFKMGAKVQATVVEKLKTGLLLNIGGKKDGFVPFCDEENDSIKDLKEGDSFEAIIVNNKDKESGAVIVSKKRADDLRLGNKVVDDLKVGDVVELIITSCNHAGLVSNLGSFEVFIPFSQISLRHIDNNLENYVNKQFHAVVVEIDLLKHKIIASIRAFEENEQQDRETAFWESIFENKIVNGKVVRFTDFGAFVNVNGVDCLVHNSEASWDRDKKASDVLELDKNYDFKVIRCDRENKRVALSFKALQENPMTKKIAQLKVGDVVHGEVKKILSFGAIISFGDGLEGLLHIKEASHFYVKNIYEVAKVGQKMDLKIVGIDKENNRVSLSLKAMQEEPDVLKMAEKIEKETKNAEQPKVENEKNIAEKDVEKIEKETDTGTKTE
jgi:4-hydroxy-3-methylbut-2-enyl diphosphate reductase